MARVTKFHRATASASRHPTEVECGWQVVSTPEGPLLQLSTYGSTDRQSAPKVSQTLQFDEDQARTLIELCWEAFPALNQYRP